MMKWEYNVVTLEDGKHKESLDFWGSQGWELAATDGRFFYLTRPVYDSPDYSCLFREDPFSCCDAEEFEAKVANAMQQLVERAG